MTDMLADSIRKHIERAGGWLAFDAFMRAALYTPEYGYYESAEVFGETGDFVTGPDMGPWLALALADLISWGWEQMGSPARWCLIEQGGGSGRLMCEVIKSLDQAGYNLPTSIVAVEGSGHMRQRQCAWYQHEGISVQQVSCLNEVEAQENTLYFCNELPDAFPVRCFAWHQQRMFERGVTWEDERFTWSERALENPPEIDPLYMREWPDGYRSEWNPPLLSWQGDIAACMQRGYVFCVDYGYAASEYYRPGRREGTLLAHLRHQALNDVLTDPGSRDITAHVDFTALNMAGREAGLDTVCWMTQGAWLAQSPSVQMHLQQLAASADVKSMQAIAAVKRMLIPQGMGELFKLNIQSCHASAGTPPFLKPGTPPFLKQFNRMHALGLT